MQQVTDTVLDSTTVPAIPPSADSKSSTIADTQAKPAAIDTAAAITAKSTTADAKTAIDVNVAGTAATKLTTADLSANTNAKTSAAGIATVSTKLSIAGSNVDTGAAGTDPAKTNNIDPTVKTITDSAAGNSTDTSKLTDPAANATTASDGSSSVQGDSTLNTASSMVKLSSGGGTGAAAGIISGTTDTTAKPTDGAAAGTGTTEKTSAGTVTDSTKLNNVDPPQILIKELKPTSGIDSTTDVQNQQPNTDGVAKSGGVDSTTVAAQTTTGKQPFDVKNASAEQPTRAKIETSITDKAPSVPAVDNQTPAVKDTGSSVAGAESTATKDETTRKTSDQTTNATAAGAIDFKGEVPSIDHSKALKDDPKTETTSNAIGLTMLPPITTSDTQKNSATVGITSPRDTQKNSATTGAGSTKDTTAQTLATSLVPAGIAVKPGPNNDLTSSLSPGAIAAIHGSTNDVIKTSDISSSNTPNTPKTTEQKAAIINTIFNSPSSSSSGSNALAVGSTAPVVIANSSPKSAGSTTSAPGDSNSQIKNGIGGVVQDSRPGSTDGGSVKNLNPTSYDENAAPVLPDSTPRGQALMNLLPQLGNYNKDVFKTLPSGLPVIIFELNLPCGLVCQDTSAHDAFVTQFQKDIAEALDPSFPSIVASNVRVLNLAESSGNTIVQFTVYPDDAKISPVGLASDLSGQMNDANSPLRKNGVLTQSVQPDVFGVDIISPVTSDSLSNSAPKLETNVIIFISVGIYLVLMALAIYAHRRYVNRVKSDQKLAKQRQIQRRSFWYKDQKITPAGSLNNDEAMLLGGEDETSIYGENPTEDFNRTVEPSKTASIATFFKGAVSSVDPRSRPATTDFDDIRFDMEHNQFDPLIVHDAEPIVDETDQDVWDGYLRSEIQMSRHQTMLASSRTNLNGNDPEAQPVKSRYTDIHSRYI